MKYLYDPSDDRIEEDIQKQLSKLDSQIFYEDVPFHARSRWQRRARQLQARRWRKINRLLTAK